MVKVKVDHVVSFIFIIVFIFAYIYDFNVSSKTQVSEIVDHINSACELSWPEGSDYQKERCVDRTMSALGKEQGLRDNELKSLLRDVTFELSKCKTELKELKND